MIRKIIIPQERTLVLELPEAFIGKEVEVLAFEVAQEKKEKTPSASQDEKAEQLQHIQRTFNKYQLDMSDYKFDRNEANDYE